MTVIQIDNQLEASRYRLLVIGGFVLLLGVIMLLLPIAWFYQLLLMILLAVCVWFSQIHQIHLLFLSSLPIKVHDDYQGYEFLTWQLQLVQGHFFVPYGETTDIYQANLVKIDDYGVVLVCDFEVFEPLPSQVQLQIWQDQVDSDCWRQLKILANA